MPTQGFIAAQIRRLAVAKMKMKTTASSLRESRSTDVEWRLAVCRARLRAFLGSLFYKMCHSESFFDFAGVVGRDVWKMQI